MLDVFSCATPQSCVAVASSTHLVHHTLWYDIFCNNPNLARTMLPDRRQMISGRFVRSARRRVTLEVYSDVEFLRRVERCTLNKKEHPLSLWLEQEEDRFASCLARPLFAAVCCCFVS